MRVTAVWIIFCFLALLALGTYTGHVPPPQELLKNLATRPEVGGKFQNSMQGRFDASVFLFTCLLATPVLMMGAVLVSGLVFVLLEATVLPVGRRLGMPDRMMLTLVAVVAASVAYARADIWLPRSLRLLGMIARAYLVSTT